MRMGLAARVAQDIAEYSAVMARHTLITAAACLLLFSNAHAQVCRDSDSDAGGEDRFYIDCDMTYKNTELMCRMPPYPVTVQPSCPADPMPMRTTERKSFIKDFSPYLFAYARDKDDTNRPYSGPYYRGTGGDASQSFQLFGKAAKGVNQISACVPQLKFPKKLDLDDPEDQAKRVRLELDNCTNQYILNSALYPYQKENAVMPSMENEADASARISLATHCQPLRAAPETQNEYLASDYLKAAWIKMMQKPNYRKTPGAPLEPHLPSGIKINNPIAPPNPFPEVRLSSIGAVPYEEINDPTHPFSPRWDFKWNERDHYSPMTAFYQKAPANSDSGGLGSITGSAFDKNAVFCAGVHIEDKNESNEQKKEDQLVKVDVLEFRRATFEEGLKKHRIGFNTACKAEENMSETTMSWWLAISTSYCWENIEIPMFDNAFQGVAKRIPCWKCFGLEGKVDGEESHPPCATGHSGQDLDIVNPYLPGTLNGVGNWILKLITQPQKLFSNIKKFKKAVCNVDPPPKRKRRDEHNIDTLCRNLRAPYTSLNKLKMRYHNPEDEQNIVLTDGVPEGYSFKEYFKNHMPYPRLWDTGRSIQRTQTAEQDPRDVLGQYTTIVGIGHEGSPPSQEEEGGGTGSTGGGSGEDSQQAKFDKLKKQDQRCLYGGWGGNQSFGGVSVSKPDPVSSWTETKLYQVRTLRDMQLSCLGRYEKAFKPGSSENMVLNATGAEYQRGIISIPKGDNTYDYQTLTDYRTAQEEGGGTEDEEAKKKRMLQMKSEAYLLAWRGYLSTPKTDQQFPNFPEGSPTLVTNLDNAELGDIVLLPKGTQKAAQNGTQKLGLPRVGLVVATNVPKESDCKKRNNCFVQVLEADNGKWPDVCGTTDTWGEMKTRTFYKEGMLPKNAKKEYDRIKSTSDCEDPHLSDCELKAWDTIKLYRVRNDERKGNDGQTDEGAP